MNHKQRLHEIDIMWKQLYEHDAMEEHDYRNGMTIRLFGTTHAFNTTREVHAFLTGAYDLLNLLVYTYKVSLKESE